MNRDYRRKISPLQESTIRSAYPLCHDIVERKQLAEQVGLSQGQVINLAMRWDLEARHHVEIITSAGQTGMISRMQFHN